MINKTYLKRLVANVFIPSLQDVNNLIAQAVNTLFTQYCKKVDPAGDCVAMLVGPQLLTTKFMQEVTENAYLAYANSTDKPNPLHFNFVARLRPPSTWLLCDKLKRDVAMAVVGFVVSSNAVTAINVYTPDLLKMAPIYMPISIDLSTTISIKMFFGLLPEPVIIGPEEQIMWEAIVNPTITDAVDVFIVWIPPIILTSRSSYKQLLTTTASPSVKNP